MSQRSQNNYTSEKYVTNDPRIMEKYNERKIKRVIDLWSHIYQ